MTKRTMTKAQAEAFATEREAEAKRTRAIAATMDSAADAAHLYSLATRLAQQAAWARENHEYKAVLDLPRTATEADVFSARKTQAVRWGDDVYLPACNQSSAPLPNILSRSPLFGAGIGDALLTQAELPVSGDSKLILTGPQLEWYERRVYLCCLNAYRQRPLAKGDGDTPGQQATQGEVRTTFYKFITESMGLAYNPEVHFAVRQAFYRLFAVNLTLVQRKIVSTCPNLIRGRFTDGLAQFDLTTLPSVTAPKGASAAEAKAHRLARQKMLNDKLKGSDELVFSIHEYVADLFGPADWTAITTSTGGLRGLAAWLHTFYSTHGSPFDYPVARLFDLARAPQGGENEAPKLSNSAYKAALREFRRSLRENLAKLATAEAGEPAFIASHEYNADADTVRVVLTKWQDRKQIASPAK